MASKTKTKKFVIDVKVPVQDRILDVTSLEKFLHNKIKVNGKAGALGDDVRVECDAERVLVMANVAFSKRYLKYLSKKYLKKHQLRDYLRVVSTGSNGYAFRYFKTGAAGDVEEED